MTQTNVYNLILCTRDGLGLTALVEARKILMPGTTSSKPTTPDPIRDQESDTCTIVRDIPWSWQQLSLLHWLHWQVELTFIPRLLFGCPSCERDLWCMYPPQPSKDFSNNAQTQSLSTCPLEGFVPSGSSLFDETFVDDAPRFPSSRSPTTTCSTWAFIFLQAPGLFTLWALRSKLDRQSVSTSVGSLVWITVI